ncbi:agmatinase [Chromatiales bacterium (ex Bugula neritina AB1)]|nr:agmatinase [Chromatiales bacterium (ex Bugula neritina AB1)]
MTVENYPEFSDPRARPRYVGLPTFLRAPYNEDLQNTDVGIIGVPFDGGVTNRPGSRHGPREVRNQSTLIRMKNQSTGIAPHDLCRVSDIGDAWVPSPFELTGSHLAIQQTFEKVHKHGIIPIAVGGDHSVSLPIFRAIAKDGPIGMIHIDAHCDTGDDYMGSKFHHGAPFSRAVEEGLLDPQRTVQIGIRGSVNDLDLWKFSHDSGMRVIYMHEFHSLGLENVIAEMKKIAGDGPVYISFDIDSLDPAFAPGTGTPEIGGLSTLEAQQLIRGCSGLNIIGADMVEVAPPFDPAGITSLAGAGILFELLCVVCESYAARTS